jgi:hypothetical protein
MELEEEQGREDLGTNGRMTAQGGRAEGRRKREKLEIRMFILC